MGLGREEGAAKAKQPAKSTELMDSTLQWHIGVCVCIKGQKVFIPSTHQYVTNGLSLGSSLSIPKTKQAPAAQVEIRVLLVGQKSPVGAMCENGER